MQKTVAEIFVETLIAAGVTRIYGVVGDSLNGLLEQIRLSKKIEWIEEPDWIAQCFSGLI
jgi:pyruvate dehydrogenase (quinone)